MPSMLGRPTLGGSDAPPTSMHGMDVLVLSPTPTFPLDHGNRKRIHTVCQDLKDRGARVHFVYYPLEWSFSHVPDDAVRAMREQWDSFHMAPVTRSLYAWAHGEDHLIDEWWDPSIGHLLGFLFSRHSYDAFIVNYPFLSRGFEWSPAHTFKILDTHDKFSGRRQLLEANGIQKEFFYTTEDQERIALDRADLVWAIKEEEAEFFRGLTRTPVVTLPHVEPRSQPERQRDPADDDYLVVGMIGARNNINRINAERFASEALPLFRRQLAPIKLRLAGGMCDDLQSLGSRAGIDLMGRLEDVADFYRAVDVVLVPMSFSTGLKIKAIEAFAVGLPIVAHRHAVEGIPVEHPMHLCSSEREVAACCLAIAFDLDRLVELRQASRETFARLAKVFRSAMDESCRMVRKSPATVMLVGPAFFERSSLYREHVLQLIYFLRHLGKIALYIDSVPSLPQATLYGLLNGLGPAVKLFSREAADGRSIGLTHHVASLPELLAAHPNCTIWCEALPAGVEGALAAVAGDCFVNLDSLSIDATAAARIGPLMASSPRMRPVGAAATLAGLGANPGALTFPVPYFRRGLEDWQSTAGAPGGWVILGTPDQRELIHSLVSFLGEMGCTRFILILEGERDAASAVGLQCAGGGAEVMVLTAREALANSAKLPGQVEFLIALEQRPALDIICQALELTSHCHALTADGSLSALLDMLANEVTLSTGQPGSRRVVPRAIVDPDAGFTRIWKRIQSTRVLRPAGLTVNAE